MVASSESLVALLWRTRINRDNRELFRRPQVGLAPDQLEERVNKAGPADFRDGVAVTRVMLSREPKKIKLFVAKPRWMSRGCVLGRH